MTRAWPALGWILLAAAVGDWLALRQRWLSHPPALLAALVAGAGLVLLLRLGLLVGRLVRRRTAEPRAAERRPGPWLAEAVLLAGLLTALGAGSANWLRSLQGFVILTEGETIPLVRGSGLAELVTGPLARLEEMGLSLALEEVELVPVGGDRFFPASHLLVWRRHGEPTPVEVTPGKAGSVGPLRFHQGAFGFAPRIVLLRGGRTLFDRTVPFTTERHGSRGQGPAGLSFAGRFTLAEEGLTVEGEVSLDSLDAALRGHATLALAVYRGDTLLGRGSLLPGHFAELDGGYRVGFAGLSRWSEVVVSRRDYGALVLGGGVAALAGALAWPLACLAGSRRRGG